MDIEIVEFLDGGGDVTDGADDSDNQDKTDKYRFCRNT
jgi:hypothetical protein